MDIKKLEEMFEPSAMKMARGNQARLDSLRLATGATDNILKIAKDLNYFKRLSGNIAIQDLSSQISQAFPQNDLAIDKSIAGIIKSLAESNSINKSLFESIKLNTALIDAFGATHLGFKPITQSISVKGIYTISQVGELGSITSKVTEIFKHYEQFRELESFKALSRMKDFPLKDILLTDFTEFSVIDNSNYETIFKMDAEISNELSSAKSFNDLSTKDQSSLINLYQTPTLFSYLTIIILTSALINSDDIFLTFNLSPLPDYIKVITLYLYQKIIEPFTVSYSAAHLYSVNQAKKGLKEVKTKSNVKYFTRKSHTSFDRSLLKGYRVNISESLELKDSPNIDTLVIDTLPIGTLLEVLDKSNRSWLLVEVEIDGELEQGWVLRRYTTYFK